MRSVVVLFVFRIVRRLVVLGWLWCNRLLTVSLGLRLLFVVRVLSLPCLRMRLVGLIRRFLIMVGLRLFALLVLDRVIDIFGWFV